MSLQRLTLNAVCFLTTLAAVFFSTCSALAQNEQAFLFNFSDGSIPQGGPVADAAGNLYGTTTYGGSVGCLDNQGRLVGCGVFFEMSPPVPPNTKWTETVLYNFGTGSLDGVFPVGDLVRDGVGNFYGVSIGGGQSNGGAVFELSPPVRAGGAWVETTLCGFGFNCEGGPPQGGLVIDQSGNLYGTALGVADCGLVTCGLVFEMTPTQDGSWIQIALHVFQGQADGAAPMAGVVFDQAGNLFGTTSLGGSSDQGVAFELSPPSQPGEPWTEAVIHDFGGPSDGANPVASLTMGPNGGLLGTTFRGGTFDSGTVFGLSPPSDPGGKWGYGVLYYFTGDDGAFPQAKLTFFPPGLLFGTTSGGGTFGNGTVFQLSSAGRGKLIETALYSFKGGSDGADPIAGVIVLNGALYGTTADGGYKNNGTAFRLGR